MFLIIIFLEHWKIVVWKLILYHETSATETSCKMASTLCHKWFKKILRFLSKSSKYCTYWTIQSASNCARMVSKYVSKRLETAFAKVSWIILMANLLQRNNFSIWHFMLPLLTLTLEVLSLSMHLWTTCRLKLNKIVFYDTYKILSFLAKNG